MKSVRGLLRHVPQRCVRARCLVLMCKPPTSQPAVRRFSLAALVGCSTAAQTRWCSQQQSPPLPDVSRSWDQNSILTTPASQPVLLRDAADMASLASLRSDVGHDLTLRLTTLLEDRRACYRDSIVLDVIAPHRDHVRQKLARYLGITMDVSAQTTTTEVAHRLQRTQIREWKELWLAKHVSPTESRDHDGEDEGEEAARLSLVRYTLQFYEVLLASDAVGHIADVALILDELRHTDFLEPNAAVFQSLLWSLPAVEFSGASPSASSALPASAHAAPSGVMGEKAQIDRVAVGDAACRYMGHALARQRDQKRRGESTESTPPGLAPVSADLWASFLSVAALTQMAPKLFDLWWDTFLEDMTPQKHNGAATQPALPHGAAYAGLSWCAASQDVERAMRLLQLCQSRGLAGDAASAGVSVPPESLLKRSSSPRVQAVQLQLLVKMLSTVKSMRFDGGVKDVFVKDIKALVSADVLKQAPWGVVNDLMSALTVPSAMQLLQLRSASSNEEEKAPFFVWAALLRRCAKEHCLGEAEGLFQFICQQFKPVSAEKRELVEIMMRMYATLAPTDYASAAHIFLEHVLRTPAGQSSVTPDAALYNLLIKAADSRNTAMMVFLEACAAGVGMDAETFEALVSANPYSTVASLSRKLPHDYSVSDLDRQMRIPANADAHARREEALHARQKPLYDSTGDVA